MRLAALLIIALAPLPVRAELVEAPSSLAGEQDGPSTSSGRTEAGVQGPIDAERAFAADAKTLGQWTAFRKWSTDDAVMFTPQPTNAHDFLKDRKDPPQAIDWWLTASYISCDGTAAANTGGWKRPDGTVGYFTTIWRRQPDGGWKWVVDGGDALKVARTRSARPKVVRASCKNAGRLGIVPRLREPDAQRNDGASADGTLSWDWVVSPDGSRVFTVWVDDGIEDEMTAPVIADEIDAPSK